MESNKKLLQSLSAGKSGSSSSKFSLPAIPGLAALKKQLKGTKPKQVVDIVVFSATIYAMYFFGKKIADSLDSQMPTEKSMMDMMKQMGPQGMGGAPMWEAKWVLTKLRYQPIYK